MASGALDIGRWTMGERALDRDVQGPANLHTAAGLDSAKTADEATA
jgi:hypothetical protein